MGKAIGPRPCRGEGVKDGVTGISSAASGPDALGWTDTRAPCHGRPRDTATRFTSALARGRHGREPMIDVHNPRGRPAFIAAKLRR